MSLDSLSHCLCFTGISELIYVRFLLFLFFIVPFTLGGLANDDRETCQESSGPAQAGTRQRCCCHPGRAFSMTCFLPRPLQQRDDSTMRRRQENRKKQQHASLKMIDCAIHPKGSQRNPSQRKSTQPIPKPYEILMSLLLRLS